MVDLAFCNNIGRDPLLLFEYKLRIDLILYGYLMILSNYLHISKLQSSPCAMVK